MKTPKWHFRRQILIGWRKQCNNQSPIQNTHTHTFLGAKNDNWNNKCPFQYKRTPKHNKRLKETFVRDSVICGWPAIYMGKNNLAANYSASFLRTSREIVSTPPARWVRIVSARNVNMKCDASDPRPVSHLLLGTFTTDWDRHTWEKYQPIISGAFLIEALKRTGNKMPNTSYRQNQPLFRYPNI